MTHFGHFATISPEGQADTKEMPADTANQTCDAQRWGTKTLAEFDFAQQLELDFPQYAPIFGGFAVLTPVI